MPPLKKILITGLLTIVALAILIVAVIVAIPSPSPEERSAFDRWTAAQTQQEGHGAAESNGGDQ